MSQSSETDNKISTSKTVELPSNQTSSVSSSIMDANGLNGPNSRRLLSSSSTYEPRENAAGGQGRTSATNELSSGNSTNTALPTQAFGSSRQSSASRSRFPGAVTDATIAESLYEPRNSSAGGQGRTSATNELSSGNSTNTALPTQAFGSSRQSSASRGPSHRPVTNATYAESLYEPHNSSAWDQGRTSAANALSSGNTTNTALPTQAFGSSRQSSASSSRFHRPVTNATYAESLYEPHNSSARDQGRTSATNELSSGNSTTTALPTQAFGSSRQSSASRGPFHRLVTNATYAESLYEPHNSSAWDQRRTSATNELSRGNTTNTALPTQAFRYSRQSSASSSRFRDAVTNATTAGPLFGPISRPATRTRLTSQLTGEASNAHLAVPTFSTPESPFLGDTASTIYNQIFPSANSNLNGGRAAQGPPMTGSFIQRPQNATISSTLSGNVLPHQAPGSNVFVPPNVAGLAHNAAIANAQPPVAGPTQPAPMFTNATFPTGTVPTGIPMNPMPILATRVHIRQSGPDYSFSTSDNRFFTRFGQVDSTDWAQLHALSHPSNLETLLSSDGTLYVQVPNRIPDRLPDRFRATPPSGRSQTSSPPAVAGRKFGEADLLNRLGPSMAEMDFPTVAEIREMVPQGGIKLRELVKIFEEHVRCEAGKKKFAKAIEEMLDGDLRLEKEGGRLMPKVTWREMVKDSKGDEEGPRRETMGKLRRRVTQELRQMVAEDGGVKTAEEVDAALERIREGSEELLRREGEEMARETARLGGEQEGRG